MYGTIVEDKISRSVSLENIEDTIMRGLMVDERVLATAKVTGNTYEAHQALARITRAKSILYTLYAYAGATLTPCMKAWLKAEPSVSDYEYLGEWCGFWHRWKNSLQFDAENRRWRMPLSNPSNLFLYSVFGEHCSTCMYSYYGKECAYCLCGVRDDLYGDCESSPACSHYKVDEHFMEGVDPEDDKCTGFMEKQNERRAAAWRDEGRPTYPEEKAGMPMEDDPNVRDTFKRLGLLKPAKDRKEDE